MDDLEKNLRALKERLEWIEKSYNPDDELNLHFDMPAQVEPALFEDLYAVGLEAWNIIRTKRSQDTLHWFYDFFLLISNASVRIFNDHTQKDYSKSVIERLVLLFIDISQMTNNREYQGDIKKRNHEALANLLLAFHNFSELRNIAITRAEEMNNQDVIDFVKSALETVREIENNKTASSS